MGLWSTVHMEPELMRHGPESVARPERRPAMTQDEARRRRWRVAYDPDDMARWELIEPSSREAGE